MKLFPHVSVITGLFHRKQDVLKIHCWNRLFEAGKVPLLEITTLFSDSTNVKCISVCPPVDFAYYRWAVDFFFHRTQKVVLRYSEKFDRFWLL